MIFNFTAAVLLLPENFPTLALTLPSLVRDDHRRQNGAGSDFENVLNLLSLLYCTLSPPSSHALCCASQRHTYSFSLSHSLPVPMCVVVALFVLY